MLDLLAVCLPALVCSLPADEPISAPADAPKTFKVREGYEVNVVVDDLRGARFMEFDDKGRLYVSRPNVTKQGGKGDSGDITVFWDADEKGVFRHRETFLTDARLLHGLCFRDGWMYYTLANEVKRAKDDNGDGKADTIETVIPTTQLPGDGSGHWWRSLLVTDDAIYTSIGDSGNITDETATERQKIWKFNKDGSGKSAFCSGIRNTEKLRLRPGTTEIWGCDHGSDWFGKELGEPTGGQPVTDLNPPDELNKLEEGKFYGHPFITGNRMPRYEYAKRKDIVELAARTTVPEFCFPAHWANNGWCFINPELNEKTGGMPKDHSGDIFVCFHGSWNRSTPGGYCVARVLFDHGKPYGMLKIVDGLADNGDKVLRPVDAVQAPDGSVLFSCDMTGKVYRIRWTGAKK